jgi:hypothetical protein
LASGPLGGIGNARLRDAILEIAINLTRCNDYFKAWGQAHKSQQWPLGKIYVAVGNRFTRISFCMVAGRTVFNHPCFRNRDAILCKLIDFAVQHGIAPGKFQGLLLRAIGQIPQEVSAEEAEALQERLPRRPRRKGPAETNARPMQSIGEILPEVLRRLVPSFPFPTKGARRARRKHREDSRVTDLDD